MMPQPTKPTLAIAAVLTLMSLFAGSAGANDLPAKTRVTILLTTLSYDLNLKSRGDALRIGVLSKTNNGDSA